MKTTVSLNSNANYGIGLDTEALEIMYEYLLQKYTQNYYRHIGIVQVDSIWNEAVARFGNEMAVKIYYQTTSDFEEKSEKEKSLIRLDVLHQALLKIADFEGKLDKDVLEQIKKEVIDNDFVFELKIKAYKKKVANDYYEAEITFIPEDSFFQLFFTVRKNNDEVWRAPFYRSSKSGYFFNIFFSSSKWINKNHLKIYESSKDFEFDFLIDKKEILLKYNVRMDDLPSYNVWADTSQTKIAFMPPEGILIYSEGNNPSDNSVFALGSVLAD